MIYTVQEVTGAAKPFVVVGAAGRVVARFAEKRYAMRKARQLNYRRGAK